MKNLNLILSIFCLLLSSSITAQDWERVFVDTLSGGLARGFDVIETSDLGYVMCGEVDLPTGAIRHHLWLVKTDANGNTLWSKIYGYYNVMYQTGRALVETDDGDLLVVGTDGQKATVFKTTAQGDSLWTKRFGGNGNNEFNDIIKKDNGDFIAVGRFEANPNSDNFQHWAMGLTADGDSTWSGKYAFASGLYSSVYSINELQNDEYLLSGSTESAAYMAVINDSDGALQWEDNYFFTADDLLLSGTYNPVSQKLVVGGTGAGFAGYGPVLLEVENIGDMPSFTSFSPVNLGAVSAISGTNDGGFISTGSSFTFWDQLGSATGFISRINSDFETIWQITYEDSLDIQGASIMQTFEGHYILAGSKGGGMFLKKIIGTPDATTAWNQNNIEVQVFPNPSHHQVTFESTLLPAKDWRIHIYDAFGRKVEEHEFVNQSERLSLAAFDSGFYFYQISDEWQTLASGKLMVF